jgi:hypothetical protein
MERAQTEIVIESTQGIAAGGYKQHGKNKA